MKFEPILVNSLKARSFSLPQYNEYLVSVQSFSFIIGLCLFVNLFLQDCIKFWICPSVLFWFPVFCQPSFSHGLLDV